jgi:immunity protein, SdpI family
LCILYFAKNQSLLNPHLLFILVGLLLIVLGNYLQSVKPNYFIGIRTPWTLENETVWKKTHELGGILFLAGGICIVILSLIINHNANLFTTLFMIIVGALTLIPILYSYLEFRKTEKAVHNNS